MGYSKYNGILRIYELLKLYDKTQEELAKHIGLTRPYFNERLKADHFDVSHLVAIADFFGVHVRELFQYDYDVSILVTYPGGATRIDKRFLDILKLPIKK